MANVLAFRVIDDYRFVSRTAAIMSGKRGRDGENLLGDFVGRTLEDHVGSRQVPGMEPDVFSGSLIESDMSVPFCGKTDEDTASKVVQTEVRRHLLFLLS